MNQIIEIAKMYNIITNKVKHSSLPVTIRELNEMVELADEKAVRIRDCLKQLHKKGLIRKVPIATIVDGRERVGYEWYTSRYTFAYSTNAPHGDEGNDIHSLRAKDNVPPPEPVDDIRIKINVDHSVTIVTKTIRITVEVPL
jgi:hypothetical protein